MTKKASKLDMTRRVARLADLLGRNTQTEAIRKVAGEFNVKPHQVHTYYLPAAREAVEADIGLSRKELVQQHHHRLNVIYNTSDSESIMLAALAQLAALHGLNAPTQVAVTVDVLYNPEEQLRALADPAMLEKVLALDAEFEEMRTENANGDGEPERIPHGEDPHPGEAGVPGDQGLQVPGPPSTSPEGTAERTSPP